MGDNISMSKGIVKHQLKIKHYLLGSTRIIYASDRCHIWNK